MKRRRFEPLVAPLLAATGCFALASMLQSPIEDWHYLASGGRALLGASGLRVYAEHHDVQVGPLGLLLAGVLQLAWLGKLATALLLVPGLRMALGDSPGRLERAASVVMCGSWCWLAVSGHLEDGLAIVLLLAAHRTTQRWWATGCLALAAAAKPWAMCAAPLLLGDGVLPLITLVLLEAAVYAPFLVQHGAMAALRVTYAAEPASLVGVLFAPPGRLVLLPSGYRLIQVMVVTLVVAFVILRRRPELALVALVVTRLLLDPGTWHYYYPPLALVMVAADVRLRHRLPWLGTASALLGLTSNSDSSIVGVLRLLALVALFVAVSTLGPRSPVERVVQVRPPLSERPRGVAP